MLKPREPKEPKHVAKSKTVSFPADQSRTSNSDLRNVIESAYAEMPKMPYIVRKPQVKVPNLHRKLTIDRRIKMSKITRNGNFSTFDKSDHRTSNSLSVYGISPGRQQL